MIPTTMHSPSDYANIPINPEQEREKGEYKVAGAEREIYTAGKEGIENKLRKHET